MFARNVKVKLPYTMLLNGKVSKMNVWAPPIRDILGGSGCSPHCSTTCELFVRHTANG